MLLTVDWQEIKKKKKNTVISEQKVIQIEVERKAVEKIKQSIRDLWDNIKYPKICVIGFLKGKKI